MKKLNIEFDVEKVDDKMFIIFHEGDIIQSFWNAGIFYEGDMLDFIKNNYKGGTFIDVGSCIGNHSVFFSGLADTVYSFEPYIYTGYHQMLNISINNIKNIKFFPFGLSNKDGILTAYRDNRSSGGTAIIENGDIFLAVAKLDTINVPDVKLIKIDVEEHELKVLEGAKNTLLKFKPDLFIECSTEKNYKEVLNFLLDIDKDYHMEAVFNNTPTYLFTTRKHEEFKDGKN